MAKQQAQTVDDEFDEDFDVDEMTEWFQRKDIPKEFCDILRSKFLSVFRLLNG